MQLGIPLLLLLILIIVSDKCPRSSKHPPAADAGHFARIVEGAKHQPPPRIVTADE